MHTVRPTFERGCQIKMLLVLCFFLIELSIFGILLHMEPSQIDVGGCRKKESESCWIVNLLEFLWLRHSSRQQ